jgi:hypothetical protein
MLLFLISYLSASEKTRRIIVQQELYGKSYIKEISNLATLGELLVLLDCSCDQLIINGLISPLDSQKNKTVQSLKIDKVNIVRAGFASDTDSD